MGYQLLDMWNNPNKMLLATNVLSSAATLIPNPIAPHRHCQLHANAHDGPCVARVKHHQQQYAPWEQMLKRCNVSRSDRSLLTIEKPNEYH